MTSLFEGDWLFDGRDCLRNPHESKPFSQTSSRHLFPEITAKCALADSRWRKVCHWYCYHHHHYYYIVVVASFCVAIDIVAQRAFCGERRLETISSLRFFIIEDVADIFFGGLGLLAVSNSESFDLLLLSRRPLSRRTIQSSPSSRVRVLSSNRSTLFLSTQFLAHVSVFRRSTYAPQLLPLSVAFQTFCAKSSSVSSSWRNFSFSALAYSYLLPGAESFTKLCSRSFLSETSFGCLELC